MIRISIRVVPFLCTKSTNWFLCVLVAHCVHRITAHLVSSTFYAWPWTTTDCFPTLFINYKIAYFFVTVAVAGARKSTHGCNYSCLQKGDVQELRGARQRRRQDLSRVWTNDDTVYAITAQDHGKHEGNLGSRLSVHNAQAAVQLVSPRCCRRTRHSTHSFLSLKWFAWETRPWFPSKSR